jgi:hypothetical protein
VRYPTARAALDAARSRITTDTAIHDTDNDHTDALTPAGLTDRLSAPSSNGAASS